MLEAIARQSVEASREVSCAYFGNIGRNSGYFLLPIFLAVHPSGHTELPQSVISPLGILRFSPNFPRFLKFPSTIGHASRDFLQVCELQPRLKILNMSEHQLIIVPLVLNPVLNCDLKIESRFQCLPK